MKNKKRLLFTSSILILAACSMGVPVDSSKEQRFDVWTEDEIVRVIDRDTGCHYIGLRKHNYPPSGLTPLLDTTGSPSCFTGDRK